MLLGGGVSINKVRISTPEKVISSEALLNGKFVLVQKGKKNYYLLKVE